MWTKTTSEQSNFCSNTVFSLYFKIRAKKIHAAKLLAFSLHFLFPRDQNHYSNLTTKIMKMCEQILKKQRPNTIQILWIVKNQEKANNSPSYRCAAIKKNCSQNTAYPDQKWHQIHFFSLLFKFAWCIDLKPALTKMIKFRRRLVLTLLPMMTFSN